LESVGGLKRVSSEVLERKYLMGAPVVFISKKENLSLSS